jgi:hypothetical protein
MGCPSYPENEEHAGALIELFTLEKACMRSGTSWTTARTG